jgi:nitroreductase
MDNSIIKAIRERRSVRNFEKKTVDKKLLEKIIQAGKYAPSAKNKQPWRFIVITNKEFIRELSREVKGELKKLLKWRFIKKISIKELKDREMLKFLFVISISKKDIIFFDAPALVLVLTKDNLFYDESCACCAENMMLAAHSLGLGSCWIGFASILGLKKKIMKKIGVPDKHHISAALIFGYPKGKTGRAPMRKIGSDVIKWIE